MKLRTKFKGTVINKKEEQSKDGSKVYYKMSIDQEGEAGTVSITQEVYEKVEKFKEFEMLGEYNDMYKSFRVLDAVLVSSGK